MRNLVLLSSAMLGACATAPMTPDTADATPIHGVTPGHKCQTEGTDQFVGQAGTAETGAAIMRLSHAAVLRWAQPGMMMTMDFREDRVTVHLDEANKVTEIKCG